MTPREEVLFNARMRKEMAGLEVSMSWGYAAIPVGAAFAMIGAVAHFLDRRSEELDLAV